jgi:N-acyl homoserine lactone hydrolase
MVDATVHALDRGRMRTDVNRIIEGYVTGSADEPNPDLRMGEGPIYNLVIDHPAATVLWDTGAHPDAEDGYWPAAVRADFEPLGLGPLEADLGDAGFALADIDYVLQTHLHFDHAGGLHNFAGTDTPVVVHAEELKHAYYCAKTGEGDDAYLAADFDRDLNWQVINRDRATLAEDLTLVHLPGHTPGLLGVILHLDEAGTVILAGDQVYVRENYEHELPLGAGLLWSRPDWFDSLRLLKDLERRHDGTVVCGHDTDDLARLQGGLS